MFTDRITRLLRLITLLQTSEPWGADALAQQLEISKRTLYRDLKTLEEAGIPCKSKGGGRYKIQDGFFMQPMSLAPAEVLGLMQLIRFVGQHRERPFHTHALSAIYKLISTVPQDLRETCGQMLSNVSIEPDPKLNESTESEHYTLLQQAVDLGRVCKLSYTAVNGEGEDTFHIEPYLLHHVNRAWYVLGKTDLHGEVRMLKLIRIQQVELLDKKFERPGSYTIQDKLGKAWRLIPEGKEYDVELIFSKRVATNVREVRWHATQRHDILDDGRCVMRFTVDGLREISWWICGYADQVVVNEPKELADMVAKLHRDAAEAYDD